jgi:ferredoxin-NADP reductase/nitrite reductase/ring-hydroxylating ferredoxin subunit
MLRGIACGCCGATATTASPPQQQLHQRHVATATSAAAGSKKMEEKGGEGAGVGAPKPPHPRAASQRVIAGYEPVAPLAELPKQGLTEYTLQVRRLVRVRVLTPRVFRRVCLPPRLLGSVCLMSCPAPHPGGPVAATRILAAAMLQASGEPLCIVTYGGSVHALYDLCPHKQGAMHKGDITVEDAAQGLCVKCPRHRKKFNGGLNFRVDTGGGWARAPTLERVDPEWCLPVYDTRVEDGWVYVSAAPKIGAVPAAGGSGDNKKKRDQEAAAGAGAGVADGSAGAAAATNALNPGLGVANTAISYKQRHSEVRSSGLRFTEVQVSAVTRVSHDTCVYRLVPAPGAPPPGAAPPNVDRASWHVTLRLPADEASGAPAIMREYTPVSSLDAWERAGTMELLIKTYPDGAFTQRLSRVAHAAGEAATLWMSQPETTLATPALLPPLDARVSAPPSLSSSRHGGVRASRGSDTAGSGTLVLQYDSPTLADTSEAAAGGSGASASPGDSGPTALAGVAFAPPVFGPGSAVVLVAGGTGVTPVLQLARWCVSSPAVAPPAPISPSEQRPQQVFVIVSQRTHGDALASAELLALADAHPDRVRLLFTFTREAPPQAAVSPPASAAVSYATGRINTGMLARFLPAPESGDVRRVVVSGPRGFFDTVQAALAAAGYSAECSVELEA